MRQTRCMVVGLLLLLSLPLFVQAAPVTTRATINTTALRLNLADLRLNVDRVLQARQVPVANRQFLNKNLEALPTPVQLTAAALTDPATAEEIGRPELSLGHAQVNSAWAKVDPRVLDALTRPYIDQTYPTSGGSPGDTCPVVGGNYVPTSVVELDGVAAPHTYYWCNTIILFEMPATASLGHVYQVTVRNPSSGKVSTAATLKVVAPRGYRGVWGLRFPNFGAAAIPWSVYSFVFGKSNVEFADGTHRPSAQTWYDNEYKGVGGGGNCWGMSQMSYRLRKYLRGDGNALVRVCNNAWVISHTSESVWSLPWDENSKQAVQSLQGLQLVNPMATYCSNQKSSQNNNSAWDFADGRTPGQPVQNTLYGHAVITFNTELSGTSRKFCFYDNNNPYSETETSGSDPNHGVTVSNTGTFSYGGYTNTRCYDPDQLMGVPTLPSGVGGDNAVEGSANEPVRFEAPRVSGLSIQDEAGRGGADGAGVPGLTEITPDMGLGPIPATFPRIFLLSNPAGRVLTFTVPNRGRQSLRLACYSRGGIVQLTANGSELAASFRQLDQPNAQVTLPNAQAAGLTQVRFIAPISQTEERSLLTDGWSGLGATPLGLSLSPDRGAVEILNAAGAPPAQFRLQLQRVQPGALNSLPAVNQTAVAGQLSRIGPANWSALQAGQLRLDRLTLPAGRLIR